MDPFSPEYISQIHTQSQIQKSQGTQQVAHVNEVQGKHTIKQAVDQAGLMRK